MAGIGKYKGKSASNKSGGGPHKNPFKWASHARDVLSQAAGSSRGGSRGIFHGLGQRGARRSGGGFGNVAQTAARSIFGGFRRLYRGKYEK